MQTFAVGGSVRDELLGRKVADRDFVVVGATPQQMLDAGFKQVGSDFPVFLHPDTGEEYALARTERKSGTGYHGFDVSCDTSVTLEDDLARRDLTVNAMARDEEGNLVDPFNGLEDLRNGVLRHVSEAFAEDPVRVLRTARFAARYKFHVAPETNQLMRQLVNSGELDNLVAERVWTELSKAVMEDHPVRFFWTLRNCDAFEVLFPELERSLIEVGSVLSRAAARQANFNQRMVLLLSQSVQAQEMLSRLRAPTDVSRLTNKMHQMFSVLNARQLDAQTALDTLNAVDAFRRQDDLFEVVRTLTFVRSERVQQHLDLLLTGFHNAKWACFATLSEEQKQTLHGRQIGQAIEKQRLQLLQSVL